MPSRLSRFVRVLLVAVGLPVSSTMASSIMTTTTLRAQEGRRQLQQRLEIYTFTGEMILSPIVQTGFGVHLDDNALTAWEDVTGTTIAEYYVQAIADPIMVNHATVDMSVVQQQYTQVSGDDGITLQFEANVELTTTVVNTITSDTIEDPAYIALDIVEDNTEFQNYIFALRASGAPALSTVRSARMSAQSSTKLPGPPTGSPTLVPTGRPTSTPTKSPIRPPTDPPTKLPTTQPTANPTKQPTSSPTGSPTANPTGSPPIAFPPPPTTAPQLLPSFSVSPIPTPTFSPVAAAPSTTPSPAGAVPTTTTTPLQPVAAPTTPAEEDVPLETLYSTTELLFSDATDEMSSSTQRLWSDITMTHVKAHVQDVLLEGDDNITPNELRQVEIGRIDQDERVDAEEGKFMLHVKFLTRLALARPETSYTADALVHGAFGTEEQRQQYLDLLLDSGDAYFSSITKVSFMTNGQSTGNQVDALDAVGGSSGGGSNNLVPLLVATIITILICVFAGLGCWWHGKRKGVVKASPPIEGGFAAATNENTIRRVSNHTGVLSWEQANHPRPGTPATSNTNPLSPINSASGGEVTIVVDKSKMDDVSTIADPYYGPVNVDDDQTFADRTTNNSEIIQTNDYLNLLGMLGHKKEDEEVQKAEEAFVELFRKDDPAPAPQAKSY